MFQDFWWYRLSITDVNDSMNDMSMFLSTVSTSFYPLIYSFHRLGMHIRTISSCKHWISPISISKMLLPYFHILCLCHSTRNLVPLQSHRGPQTCLHQAIHSCAGLSFDKLGICISRKGRADDSRTLCSQWSSWSCVPPMHGLSILYRWLARLSVRISPDSFLPLSLNCAEWTRLGIE